MGISRNLCIFNEDTSEKEGPSVFGKHYAFSLRVVFFFCKIVIGFPSSSTISMLSFNDK